jgi:hypothetical protein
MLLAQLFGFSVEEALGQKLDLIIPTPSGLGIGAAFEPPSGSDQDSGAAQERAQTLR